MEVKKILSMNAGDGQNSYENNSSTQRIGILKAQPILEEALESLCNNHFPIPECFRMADLGCSSGPNTLFLVANIIDRIQRFLQLHKDRVPEFEVFLNDLPQNDFNNLFKLLPNFYEKLKQQQQHFMPIRCCISATPGSFYGRLFPSNSLHFIHSSYSLQWLSKIPESLENNKGNIYITRTSPPDVIEAYYKQFQKDFSTFLSSRAEEIMPGWGMVFTIVCRDVADHAVRDDILHITMIKKSLLDLAAEGLVKEADIDSFNLPLYFPYKEEVKAVVRGEGSFKLCRLEVFEINWVANDSKNEEHGVFDKYEGAKFVAGCVRAFMEPLLATHFGSSTMDPLFERYTQNITQRFCVRSSYFNMVVSLTRK